MAGEEDSSLTEAEVDAAIAAAARKIQQRVQVALTWLRRQTSVAELEQHLTTTGTTEAALVADDIERAATAIATEINGAYLDSGSDVTEVIDRVTDSSASFGPTDSLAVKRMQANDLRLVRGLTEEQRNVIREVITEGMRENKNPRAIAVDLYDAIGLTPEQAKWVSNYRRELYNGNANALERELRDARFDRTVQHAVDGDVELSHAQIDRMVERYRKNAIKMRAETIARTEALRAVHQGQADAIQAAIDRGELQADQVVQTWWTKLDGRERDSHYDMHGQVRAFDELFESGNGNFLRYPGDPGAPASDTINCRCTLALVFTPAIAAARKRWQCDVTVLH